MPPSPSTNTPGKSRPPVFEPVPTRSQIYQRVVMSRGALEHLRASPRQDDLKRRRAIAQEIAFLNRWAYHFPEKTEVVLALAVEWQSIADSEMEASAREDATRGVEIIPLSRQTA